MLGSTLAPLVALLLALPHLANGDSLENNQKTFARPIVTRFWQNGQKAVPDDFTAQQMGAALCRFNPSYVNGLLYVNATDYQTNDVIKQGYNEVRNVVKNGDGKGCKGNPDAKFDIEITINTEKDPPKFTSNNQLKTAMIALHTEYNNDGFWFDFYTQDYTKGGLADTAVATAQQLGCTIGGNVFQPKMGIPPKTDAIAFVDDIVSIDAKPFGFAVDLDEVSAWTKTLDSNTVLLGHLASNPQNQGNDALTNEMTKHNGLNLKKNYTSTESCVYNGINNTYVGDASGHGRGQLISVKYDITKRSNYNRYWAGLQKQNSFTYMFPAFYPVCPANPFTAHNALADTFSNDSSLLDVLYDQQNEFPGPNA